MPARRDRNQGWDGNREHDPDDEPFARPIDEGPSDEDLRRFADGDSFCPECGAEIHDLADVCPKCYAYVAGETSRFRPVERDLRSRFIAVTVVVLILVLLGWGIW